MALEVAVHPAAAVDEQQRRRRLGAQPLGRGVEPGVQRTLARRPPRGRARRRSAARPPTMPAVRSIARRASASGRPPTAGTPASSCSASISCISVARRWPSRTTRPTEQPPLHPAREAHRRREGRRSRRRTGGRARAPTVRSRPVHLAVGDCRTCPPTASSQPSGPTRRRVRSTRACASSRPTSSTSTRPTTRRTTAFDPGEFEDRFLDRELSWLRFNQRVLELAEDEDAAAARAGAVPGHLRQQPRRVLHGPRRRAQAPDRRRRRRTRRVRADAARGARPDLGRRPPS